jgi:hypothetical protein
MSTFFTDALLRPRVFRWNGPIDRDRIEDWVREQGWDLPQDLIAFWAATGGGEVFDSELLLPPLPGPGIEDDVASRTRYYVSIGMLGSYVVFHEGAGWVSAIRLADRRYVQLDETHFREHGEHESLEAWYSSVIRAEFAERYGLPWPAAGDPDQMR